MLRLNQAAVQRVAPGAFGAGLDDQVGVLVIARGRDAGVKRAVPTSRVEPSVPVVGEDVLDRIGVLIEQGAIAVSRVPGGRNDVRRKVRKDERGLCSLSPASSRFNCYSPKLPMPFLWLGWPAFQVSPRQLLRQTNLQS